MKTVRTNETVLAIPHCHCQVQYLASWHSFDLLCVALQRVLCRRTPLWCESGCTRVSVRLVRGRSLLVSGALECVQKALLLGHSIGEGQWAYITSIHTTHWGIRIRIHKGGQRTGLNVREIDIGRGWAINTLIYVIGAQFSIQIIHFLQLKSIIRRQY